MKANDEIKEILFDAIETGDTEAVRKITDSGVPVNVRNFLGRTALFWPVIGSCCETSEEKAA